MENPKCAKCKHYYVTFDQTAPHGCRLYQMKSKMLPYLVVKTASGQTCQSFELKAHFKDKETNESKDKINFNDQKYWE